MSIFSHSKNNLKLIQSSFNTMNNDNKVFASKLGNNSTSQADIQNSNIKTIIFPNELKDENYKFKKFSIFIAQNNNLGKDATELIQSIQNSESIKEGFEKTANTAKKALGAVSSEIRTGYAIKKDFPLSEMTHCLVLPLPNNLTESIVHSFDVDMGMVGDLMQKSGIQDAASTFQKYYQHFGKQKIMGYQDKYQNYNGSEPRRFDFQWKIVPSSMDEAINGIKLIYTLKKYSSPSLMLGNLAMVQPRFFYFVFGNPALQNLVNPLCSVITNVSATYDDGTYVSTTLDGIPKTINLSISFAENRPLNESDFDLI